MKFSFLKRISALALALALALSLLPNQPVNPVSNASFTAYAADYNCNFADKELFLCEGTTKTPALKGALPEGAIFLSDNSEAVSVDPATGKLTCVSYGTAVITLYAPIPEETEEPEPENPAPENPDLENPAPDGEEVETLALPIRTEVYDDSAFVTPMPQYEETADAPAEEVAMDEETPAEDAPEAEEEPIDTLAAEPAVDLETYEELDSLVVYSYRPSTYSIKKSGTKNTEPDPYRMLTVKNATEDYPTSRTYGLFRQHFDKVNYPYLTSHGCSSVAAADICQGYGVKKITQLWLLEKGLAAIAQKNGVSAADAKKYTQNSDSGTKTLGWSGIKAVLAYAGIPSEINTWSKDDNTEAIAGITEALSQGHPVILMIYGSNTWKPTDTRNGTRDLSKLGNRLAGDGNNHYILLTGIDKDGYVMNSCGSNANCQTINSVSDKAAQMKLTVKELLDHFVRLDSSSATRTATNDFFFNGTGKSGYRVWLEVMENEAHDEAIIGSIENMTATLSETEFVYDAEEHKPTVSIDGLVADADFEIVGYKNNVNAGTASVTVRGIHSYYGEKTLDFTIKKAENVLSVSGKTVATDTKPFALEAKRLLDDGKLTYKSSNPTKVSVSTDGNVTVAKNFVGKVTITVATPTTPNTEADTKTVTIKVIPQKPAFTYAKSPAKKTVQLKWKPASVSGYEVEYAYNDRFEGSRTYTTSNKSAKSKKFTGLVSKKVIYVRMRTYKKVSGVTYKSKWSTVKKITVK